MEIKHKKGGMKKRTHPFHSLIFFIHRATVSPRRLIARVLQYNRDRFSSVHRAVVE